MEKVYTDKRMCSGCGACRDICPFGAIEMISDKEGFFYPEINQEKCKNCGLCAKLCAFKREKINYEKEPRKILGVKIKDLQERKTSRSGGMFTAMANYILSQNGVIYGCVLGENLDVFHTGAETKEDADKFKGSKYVKSNLKDVYSKIKEDLKTGRKVLFSGTGCEVAGLLATLKNVDTSNLYTCDIICHGVPSPLIYKEFIDFIEKEHDSKILHIDFRDKSYGWSTHKETLTFNDKKITTNYFTELFYSHHILRPSCFNCQFSNIDRVADITIGDFWGIQDENKDFHDEDGISLALVNTEKGESIVDNIKEDIHFINVTTKSYIQHNLKKPSIEPENREEFWKDYEENDFEFIMKKYAKYEK